MFGILKRFYGAVGKRLWPVAYARSLGVRVGEDCRLIQCEFSTEPYLVRMGNHVSATRVRFETHDGGIWCIRDRHPTIDRVKPIVVGDNVYIGYGAIILPGVEIGSNVVIGAASVVTKAIPSNSVVAGVPARVIKSLDEYEKVAIHDGAPTKAMSPDEKRNFYEKRYGI